MQHIKNLLAKSLKQSGFSHNVEVALVIEEFKKLIQQYFGTKINKKIKPLYIKNKVLTVACLSTIVTQEVTFKKEELISNLNGKFKSEVIKDIRFVI